MDYRLRDGRGRGGFCSRMRRCSGFMVYRGRWRRMRGLFMVFRLSLGRRMVRGRRMSRFMFNFYFFLISRGFGFFRFMRVDGRRVSVGRGFMGVSRFGGSRFFGSGRGISRRGIFFCLGFNGFFRGFILVGGSGVDWMGGFLLCRG